MIKDFLQEILADLLCFFEKQKRSRDYKQQLKNGIIQIGRHSYGHPIVLSNKGSEAKIIIGNFCSISKGVTIITGGIHPKNWVSTFPFRIKWNMLEKYKDGMPTTKGNIIIGSDVWIGTEAMILSGIKIGDGAIVAARALVTEDVPEYSIVAGVPAKVKSYRFDKKTIEALLKIKWWNWEDEKIKEAVPLLSSNKIEKFIKKYEAK